MDSIAGAMLGNNIDGMRAPTHLRSVREAHKPGNPAPNQLYQAVNMTCRKVQA